MQKTFFYLLLLALSACTANNQESQPPEKPNIVLIFADDMTYKAVHALGNEIVETPNLDRLVESGVAFTHAYNMGGWNGAVCVASRSMMVSGRFVWRANQFKENWRNGAELDKTWGKIMERNGYDTYMSGKWHVAAKATDVFQNVTHVRPGMPKDAWPAAKVGQKLKQTIDGKAVDPYDIMPVGYARPRDENDKSWSPSDPKFGGFWEGDKHWSEVLKDDALSFIDQAAQKDAPFFMYLAFNAPHDPRQAPQEFVDKYPIDNIQLPANWRPEHPYKDSIGLGWGLRDEALAPIPRTEYATKVHLQEYYAIITHMDEQIGKILDALEKSGKMDNTYVFFTADHGLSVGSHGLLGKQNMYEHSMRVPLMIAGPGIPKGKKVDADVYLQDIMATSLELGGIDKPDYVEFNSFLDLAEGRRTESYYDAIYGCYVKWQRMIRKDGFKLIVHPRAEDVLLFDLNKDPDEMNDLSDDPQYAEKLKSLFDELIQLQKEMDDELDLREIYELVVKNG